MSVFLFPAVKSVPAGWLSHPFSGAAVAFLLSVMFFGLFKRISTCIPFHALSMLGRYSLEIYLIHEFIITVLRPFLNIGRCAGSVIINTVLSAFLPIPIALLMRKIGLHTLLFRPVSLFKPRRSSAPAK